VPKTGKKRGYEKKLKKLSKKVLTIRGVFAKIYKLSRETNETNRSETALHLENYIVLKEEEAKNAM